jgi:hypothetical protein
MATRPTRIVLGDGLAEAARRAMGLPDGTPTAQVVRAALLRIAGNPDADGAPTDRGGRPKGYSPKRAREHAPNP